LILQISIVKYIVLKSLIHDAKMLYLYISGVLGLSPCLVSDFRVLLASEQLCLINIVWCFEILKIIMICPCLVPINSLKTSVLTLRGRGSQNSTVFWFLCHNLFHFAIHFIGKTKKLGYKPFLNFTKIQFNKIVGLLKISMGKMT